MTTKNIPALPRREKLKIDNNLLSLSVKKVPSTQRSKKFPELATLTDHVRAILAAGSPVSELDIQPLCRRYPGDSLKALKQLHRFYPTHTILSIQNNVWTLTPIVTEAQQ